MTDERPGMTDERWHQLMNEEAELTPAEIVEGWHWCPEWDLLLTNPNEPNGEQCSR